MLERSVPSRHIQSSANENGSRGHERQRDEVKEPWSTSEHVADENAAQHAAQKIKAEAKRLIRTISGDQVDTLHSTAHAVNNISALDPQPQQHDDSRVADESPKATDYKGTVLGTLLATSNLKPTEPNTPYRNDDNVQMPTSLASCTPLSYRMKYRNDSCTQEICRNRSSFPFFDFNVEKKGFDDIEEATCETDRGSTITALPGENKSIRFDSYTSTQRETLGEGVVEEIADILARRKYLLRLCELLLQYGAPTHRIELNLANSAHALAVEASFLYIPNVIICTFVDRVTYVNSVEVVRKAVALDCGRMQDVTETGARVLDGTLTAEQGLAELDAIAHRPNDDHAIVHIIVHGLTSAFIAPLAFDANLIDLIPVFFLGCYLGFLRTYVVAHTKHFSHTFEVFACISIAFIARAIGSIPWPDSDDENSYIFCFSAIAQSSIVLILPGVPVLHAALELQSKNIISGSVRMVWCIIFVLFISFGLLIGNTIFGLMMPSAVDNVTCNNPDWFSVSDYPDYKLIYTRFIWVPLFTASIGRFFRAKWSELPIMSVVATTGYQIQFWVATQMASNPHVANAVGSFAIGCMGTAYARFARKGAGLAAAVMLPAVCVQVPGGLASAGGLVASIASSKQILTNDTHVSIITNGTRGLLAAQSDPESVYSGTIFHVSYSMVKISIGLR